MHMKKLSIVFGIFAIFLSDIMCAVVAYNYCDLLWGRQYAGYSAPASTAFVYVIPYALHQGFYPRSDELQFCGQES